MKNQLLITILLIAITVSTLVTNTANAHEAWTLDGPESNITFVTIKKGNIAENHRFTIASGSLSKSTAMVKIKADSVDTSVPIRNERLREFLFQTNLYPEILIKADVTSAMELVKESQTLQLKVPATLSMHGIEKQIELDLRVSQLNDNTVLVNSISPVLIRAKDYGMLEGVLKLSSLVNNLAIAEAVPVSFSLMFKR